MTVKMDDVMVNAVEVYRLGIIRIHQLNKNRCNEAAEVGPSYSDSVTQCPACEQVYYFTPIELETGLTDTNATSSEVGGGLSASIVNFGAKGGKQEESVAFTKAKITIPIFTPAIIITPN